MAFSAITGQDAAVEVLVSALEKGRVPHAYLFAGPEGVGKRTAALEWAKVMNCPQPVSLVEACGACPSCRRIEAKQHPDVLFIDFSAQARALGEPVEKQRALKIDTIREMDHALRLKPLEGKVKVALIDPADRLVPEAAHALLKILEEPPTRTHLILFASDASALLGTIRSRCQWVRFRPLPADVIVELLKKKGAAGLDDDLRRAALQSEGSLSRALAILEEGDELAFDWENAPLSELAAWLDQFHSKTGRAAADTFLRRLLARFEAELREGRRDEADVARVLESLHRLKQNVSPQLTLEVLLLRFRWDRRGEKRAAAAS